LQNFDKNFGKWKELNKKNKNEKMAKKLGRNA
jgi:hypothetical protein